MKIRRAALLLGLVILAVDVLTKWWIASELPRINSYLSVYPYGGIPVFRDVWGVQFSIIHATNTGAAWSLFSSFPKALVFVRVLFIVPFMVWALFFNRVRARDLPIMLIIAGAVGNIIDMFVYGHVVDMFFFIFWGYPYPVFNVADVAIFLGVSGFILQSVCKKRALKCSR